jgi:hypothetical protein
MLKMKKDAVAKRRTKEEKGMRKGRESTRRRMNR